MTDIIDRLRSYNRPWPKLMDEAADEIERLQGEVEALREERERCAKVAETTEREGFGGGAYNEAGRDIAAAIRNQP